MIDGMLVVDFHNHISRVDRALSGSFYDTLGQTPGDLVARMDKYGIDIAVIWPVSTGMLTPEAFSERNDYLVQAVRQYPERLVGFCVATPLHGEFALDEIRRGAERGMKGIKLHPLKHGGYPLNSELLDPILHLARELDLVVFAPTDFNNQIYTPYQARLLAMRHPEVTVIMGHYGLSPTGIHWVPEVVKDTPNIVLDSSGTPDMPYYVFNRPCEILGAERIVFGSDTPDLHPAVSLKKLQVAEELYGLSKEDKRKILGENMVRMLKLKV